MPSGYQVMFLGVCLFMCLWCHHVTGNIFRFKKPSCEPTEPCQYNINGFKVQFCSCPGDNKCQSSSDDKSILFKGTKYQFCGRPSVDECSEGDVSWVKRGFRLFVKCRCPESMDLQSLKWDQKQDIIEYICTKKSICDVGDKCKIREYFTKSDGTNLSALREHCKCPADSICQEHNISDSVKRSVKSEAFYCVKDTEK